MKETKEAGMNQVKWMWNGIKVDGKLYRAFYSKRVLINDTEESITLYAKDYDDLPKLDGLVVQNDSDGMRDYFETDRARIRKGSKYWNVAYEAWKKQQETINRRMEKRALKHGFEFRPVEVV